jgi:hypothetical protein
VCSRCAAQRSIFGNGRQMPKQRLDTLLALKALHLVLGLTANDRRVAAVLLEHFNRRTNQCDPSLRRIARLLGISTRTVIRSNHNLERAGLFKKTRHGGHFNRNFYEPIWSRFGEIEAEWRARFRTARSLMTEMSPVGCQPCHVDGDSSDSQTCSSNLLNETCSKGLPKKEQKDKASSSWSSSTPVGTPSAQAARVEAERRWTHALHKQFGHLPVTYAQIIDRIDAPMQEAATDAEMLRHGAGLLHILRELRIPSKGRGG